MGLGSSIASWFGFGSAPQPDRISGVFSDPSDYQLTQLVASELLPTAAAVAVTKQTALSVAPFRKGHDLICTTIASWPLKAARGDELLPQADQPTWAYRDDDPVSAYLRMFYTVSDLLLFDICVWRVWRGTQQAGARYAPILKAHRVPKSRWALKDHNGKLTYHVDDEPMADDQVIVFDGMHDGIGLLDSGRDDFLAAKSLGRSRVARAISSSSAWHLKPTEDLNLSEKQKKKIVNAYNLRRQTPDGAVIFGEHNIEIEELGQSADAGVAMTQASNEVRVNMANLLGIPAAILDGSVSTASLTYSTTEGKRNEFADLSSVKMIGLAIEGRLSQADVAPQGQRMTLDRSDYYATLPDPIGPDTENATTAEPAPRQLTAVPAPPKEQTA